MILNNGIIRVLGLFLLIINGLQLTGTPLIIDKSNFQKTPIASSIETLSDTHSQWSLKDVISKEGWSKNQDKKALNFGMTQYSHWSRFSFDNRADNIYIKLGEPLIDEIELFFVDDSGNIHQSRSGASLPFSQREVSVPNYLFKLPKGAQTVYMRLKSNFNLKVPVTVASLSCLLEDQHLADVTLSLYFGLMLIMIIYNFFVYLSLRDPTYLYYITYILLVTLFYATLKGFSFEYIWFSKPSVNYFVPTIATLPNIFVTLFIISLLQTKVHLPRLTKGIYAFIGIFVLCIVINFLGFYITSTQVSQLFTSLCAIYLINIGIQSYRKGVKAAKFFLLAWTFYLISVVIFILQLNGVIESNVFTRNVPLYGSALEAILLSLALADKINTYKREKEIEQQEKLVALEENKRIIINQNQILEQKVKEKTKELVATNSDLNKALHDLKNTQVSLVESEKMASLGQLTAGVAHEINNPINFVSSNVKPLIRDFEDINTFIATLVEQAEETNSIDSSKISTLYDELDIEYTKKEIQDLLVGIQEGANRTAEIVKGLKNFSRLDEADFKTANIEEGLDSTLILLRSNLKGEIDLVKEYGNIPEIDCYAGKLNQVFMNLINNSIYAILNDPKKEPGKKGVIKLSTENEKDYVRISISDSGMGMDQETINKLFDPFYTTKPVGEGTGLGMSITYSIINELHKGNIQVESEIGKGTTIDMRLPKALKK